MEEKREKMKVEAYYAKWLEEVRTQTKNLSLMARWSDENDLMYQIWSYGLGDEETRHPTHGLLFAKFVEGMYDEKSVFV